MNEKQAETLVELLSDLHPRIVVQVVGHRWSNTASESPWSVTVYVGDYQRTFRNGSGVEEIAAIVSAEYAVDRKRHIEKLKAELAQLEESK